MEERIMRTLAKIGATLGVLGAIAVGSAVPAAAWYGYYHHRYYHNHYGYYPYHHRHYSVVLNFAHANAPLSERRPPEAGRPRRSVAANDAAHGPNYRIAIGVFDATSICATRRELQA